MKNKKLAMKFSKEFEDFVNESNELNEMPMNRRYDDGQYSILSMGSLNIKTGECKHFNVYKTFDGTAEIYKDSTDKFKIVFTAGSSPIKNRDKSDLKAGDRRAFKDDQRGTPLFIGSFVESCRVNQLQDVAGKLSIKSCIGYTYK